MDSIIEAGTKHDSGKPQVDLIDPNFIIGMASVMSFGAEKYSRGNWQKGIQISRLISSLYRHFLAVQKGEIIDPESGLPHLWHIGANTMMLNYMFTNRQDLNDLIYYMRKT